MIRVEHAEFARLIAPHLDALFRAAYRLTGNRADAEDLVQDVCVRAYANLHSFDELERPKSCLMKIQYRLFVDGARRRSRSPVRATADDLDATCASALHALHVEGYTLAELESITDLSTDVLKARLYRARVRLGKLLATERGTTSLMESKA
jgi:RNA polymerase sigma-70 factor (ECF subfamily)